MRMAIVLAAVCVWLAVCLWREKRKTAYWRDNAIRQGRKRTSGADRECRSQEINRQAAHKLFLLGSEVERLTDENLRLRNVNRNLLRQMDRRIG